MPHQAKIIADSISSARHRLTTFEICFPRIILAEFNTHRAFSRNSASSRAIPVEKMIKMVGENPYIPTHWGKNQKGMSADVELSEEEQQIAESQWRTAASEAIHRAKALLDIGVHKQITNRLLEPFMWHTVIVTATEWDNWTHLRDNPQAHPEIAKIAHMMNECLEASKPELLDDDDWHLPYVSGSEISEKLKSVHLFGEGSDDEATYAFWKKVSIGRCARVSYLTHDGKRDPKADVELHDRLMTSGHMSPFEHAARPMTKLELECLKRDTLYLTNGRVIKDVVLPHSSTAEWKDWSFDGAKVDRVEHSHFCGNFNGWIQARKEIPHEHDILGSRT